MTAHRTILLNAYWEDIVNLYDRIRNDDIPSKHLCSSWDAIARGAYIVCCAVQGVDQFERCFRLEEVIFGALDDSEPSAAAVDDGIEDESGEAETWGALTARVEATRALLELTRILHPAHERILDKVASLAREGSPAVRDSVFFVLGQLQKFQPKLAFELCDLGFSNERNPYVLVSLLRSCRSVLRDRPAWLCRAILALDDRIMANPPESDTSEALADQIVSFILHLWLVHQQGSAEARINVWLAAPTRYEYRICSALSALRSKLVRGEVHPVA